METNIRYFTFPVQLLKGALSDIRTTTQNIINYCGYVQASKENGSEQEKMKKAGVFLGVTWGDGYSTYINGKELFSQIPDRSPMTSVNKRIVFDFFENSKTEFEIISFLAFCAVRSMLQKKPFYKATNEYLFRPNVRTMQD